MSGAGSMRSALVTGGAGFIGSHLVDRLVDEGWSVRVLDDLSTGREENLRSSRQGIELIRGDLCDEDALARALAGVVVVFHQAAIPSVPRSVADPLRTHAVNASGTLLLLEQARRAGVRRVVYAASSSAYGDAEVLPKLETMPAMPLSPYALQKYTGECYCRLYSGLYGLETVALRYFNVFGPRQDPASQYAAVVPRFVCAALAGESPCIFGDGEQTRDFTYVDDAVTANLLAAVATKTLGEVVNVAGGRRTSLKQLWASIAELTGVKVAPVHEPPRPGDVRHSLADLGRARALLGYAPRVSLRDGLLRTIESHRSARTGEATP